MIKILENLVPNKPYEEIKKVILSEEPPNFPWWWHHGHSSPPDDETAYIDEKTDDYLMLNHLFYTPEEVSPFFKLVAPMIQEIEKRLDVKVIDLCKFKGNLTLPSYQPHDTYSIPHKDQLEGWTTVLYYLNGGDGDTLFFDNNKNIIKRISPIKNGAVVFPSDMFHCAANNQTIDRRVVFNIVLKFNKEKNK